jgi:hypothetical protein
LKTITLEEHFVSPGFVAGPGRNFMEQLQPQVPAVKGSFSSFRKSATGA